MSAETHHTTTDIGSDTHAREPRPVLDGLGWTYEPSILADAQDQAVPFRGDATAHDRAWSARVQSAFDSMDVLDPGGLDTWMEAHAKSDQPHLAEAALVAVWETCVRDLYTAIDDSPAPGTNPSSGQSLDEATDRGFDDADGLP